MVSLTHSERGVIVGSKSMPYQELEKVTYEKLFYHIPNHRKKPQERETAGSDNANNQFSDSQFQEELGATATSNSPPYGFPISIGRENWCTQLKQRVFK